MRPQPRTRFLTRLAGGVTLLALLGVGVSACDASPYAAIVNGRVVRSSTLNADLKNFTENTKLVDALHSQGSSVWGASTSSYNSSFVAGQLTTLVNAQVVSSYIAEHHLHVSDGLLDAARSVEQLAYGSVWTGFPPSYRDTLVRQAAEHALIEPMKISASTLNQTFKRYKSRFYSIACVRTLTITATRADGSVNFSASRAQATRLVSSINRRSSAAAAGSVHGGSLGCYTPAQLEAQTNGAKILAVPTYHATKPVRQSFGYRVQIVTHRAAMALHPNVAKALNGYFIQAGDATDTKLNSLLRSSDIKVNAAFGTWDAGAKSPGVAPPTGPNTTKRKPASVQGVGSALVGGLAKP